MEGEAGVRKGTLSPSTTHCVVEPTRWLASWTSDISPAGGLEIYTCIYAKNQPAVRRNVGFPKGKALW